MAYDEYRTGSKKIKKTKEEEEPAYSDSKMPLIPVTPTNTEGIVQAYNALAPDTATNASSTTNIPSKGKQRRNGEIGYGAGDVGGTETVGTETVGTDAVVNAYGGAISKAEQTRADELSAAESNREKAIQSAQNAYNQMLTTSAQNQEQLARMGLPNSGYSDYINASAQAVKRGEISQAQADYATSVKDIERAYNNAISEAESERNTSYLSTLAGLESGEIRPSIARENAKAQGFTEEQMSNLENMISAAKKKTISDYQGMIETGTSINAAELKSQVVSGNLDKDDTDEIMAYYFDKIVSGTDETVMPSQFLEFDKAYQEGLVKPKTYQAKYGEFAAGLADTDAFEGTHNEKYDKAYDAIEKIKTLYNSKKINEKTYKDLTAKLSQYADLQGYVYRDDLGEFNDSKTNVTFAGVKWALDSEGVKSGKDFEVLNEISTGKTNGKPKDGTIVGYNGSLWVRKNSQWWQLIK